MTMQTSNDKSKKNKGSNINKTELWNIFDTEITNDQKSKAPLECIYRACGNREVCDRCESILAFSDEGFLTCLNSKCGIIYKDIVDQSAEWRFYGADDNHNSDPTRCGMPINPLLKESSYGCKVICVGSMSYEMRKIRRYTEWQSMPYKEKSQYDEFQIITNMAHNAGIPKMIIDDAIRYHKKISEYESELNTTIILENMRILEDACFYISKEKNRKYKVEIVKDGELVERVAIPTDYKDYKALSKLLGVENITRGEIEKYCVNNKIPNQFTDLKSMDKEIYLWEQARLILEKKDIKGAMKRLKDMSSRSRFPAIRELGKVIIEELNRFSNKA